MDKNYTLEGANILKMVQSFNERYGQDEDLFLNINQTIDFNAVQVNLRSMWKQDPTLLLKRLQQVRESVKGQTL